MKFTTPTPLIRAIIVAVIVGVVGWFGLDLPRTVVEETVDQQLASWEGANAGDTTEPVSRQLPGVVTDVVDGDTITVTLEGRATRLRLIGIDTPEVAGSPAGAECYGVDASERATELLLEQPVIVTTDPTQAEYDDYDRLLAYVTLPDGRDVGEVLIEEGYAREVTYAGAYQNQEVYQTAETAARGASRGRWSACTD